MKQWTRLADTTLPDGSMLALDAHDGEHVLRKDGLELASSRADASEVRLGVVGATAAAQKPKARLLIGGLGLGATLRAVLGLVRADAEVVVAEPATALAAWLADPAHPIAQRELADPRTRVVPDDVYQVLAAAPRASSGPRPGFDVVMLDADHGMPSVIGAARIAELRKSKIARVRDALRPGGVAVLWLAHHDLEPIRALERSGFVVTWEHVPAWGTGGTKRTVILARPRAGMAEAPRPSRSRKARG